MLKLFNFCLKTYNLQYTASNVIIINIFIDVLYISSTLYIHTYILYVVYMYMYFIYIICMYMCYIYVLGKTNNVSCQLLPITANELVVSHGLGDKMTHNS